MIEIAIRRKSTSKLLSFSKIGLSETKLQAFENKKKYETLVYRMGDVSSLIQSLIQYWSLSF